MSADPSPFRWASSCARVAGVPAAALAIAPFAAAQTVHDLGILPGYTHTMAYAMSADGSVVVGQCEDGATSIRHAVRWTLGEGLVDMGTLPGGTSATASSVSADGTVIVGSSNIPGGSSRAYRWTLGTGMQPLGVPAGSVHSAAAAVSPDGTTIVGTAPYNSPETILDLPFKWTQAGGFEMLPLPAGKTAGVARAISSDKAIIAGDVGVFSGPPYSIYLGIAHEWSGGTNQTLGLFPGGNVSSAFALSADGSVSVGYADTPQGFRAFRRTASEFLNLGLVPGSTSGRTMAFTVSADGSVVAGAGIDGPRPVGWIWTAETGMVELNVYFASQGMDLAGWNLTQARAISADGTAMCGYGVLNGATRGWVVTGLHLLPCAADYNRDGFVDFFDADAFVAAFEAGEPSADFNGDGFLDFFDADAFLAAFEAGC